MRHLSDFVRMPRAPKMAWVGVLMPSPLPSAEGSLTLIMWIDKGSLLIGGADLVEGTQDALGAMLFQLNRFAADSGRRPASLMVRDEQVAEAIRKELGNCDTQVEVSGDVPEVDQLIREALGELDPGLPARPALASGKGVKLEHVKAFAAAAKRFYEAAPWRMLSDTDLIGVESPTPVGGMKFITLMGHGGQTFGMAFYRSRSDFEALCEDGLEGASKRTHWAMLFGAKAGLSPRDQKLWDEHSFPVASPEAYPEILGAQANGTSKAADVKLLEYVTLLLDAMAKTTEEQIDAGRWSVRVDTPSGNVQVKLTLPDVLEPPDTMAARAQGSHGRGMMEQMQFILHRRIAEAGLSSEAEVQKFVEREFTGKTAEELNYTPKSKEEEAQLLAYEALDASGRHAVSLARRALALWSDCADACYVLGNAAGASEEARQWYQRGLDAARRTLDPALFGDAVGEFWGILETRPFMRCMQGMADLDAHDERYTQAADRMLEMIRLNPRDNQGVRYQLVSLLIRLDRDEEAARILKAYPDDMAAMNYLQAMVAFRLGGDCETARHELAKAVAKNPYLWAYLSQDPDELPTPGLYSPGSMDEALVMLSEMQEAIEATPDFVDFAEKYAPRYVPAEPEEKPRRSRAKRRGK